MTAVVQTAPKITAHHFQDYEINDTNLAPLLELVRWARQNNIKEVLRADATAC